MVTGGNITITVPLVTVPLVTDVAGNGVKAPNSATHTGGAVGGSAIRDGL